MSTRIERLRKEIQRSNSPLKGHSMNQQKIKFEDEGYKRVSISKKELRSKRNRLKNEQYINEIPRMQFDRSISNALNGIATSEDLLYITQNLPSFEKQIYNKIAFTEIQSNNEEKNTKISRDIFVQSLPEISQNDI